MPDALKYYDSNNTIVSPQHSDELPKKRFEFIVQAMKSGEYEIPPQLFTYFDVERCAYITLRTSPLVVSIMPGGIVAKKDITTSTVSTLPKVSESDGLKDINKTGSWYPCMPYRPLPWWLFKLLFLLPCFYLFYPFVWQRLVMLTGSSQRLARRKALRYARRQIKECVKNNDDKQLYSIFITLLQSDTQANNGNLIGFLSKKSDVSPELMREWNVFFERITYAAYAQSGNENRANELCKMAQKWLERF